MAVRVVLAKEELEARTPVVIGGALGVEAGDIRSRAKQCRRVLQPRELLLEQRPDRGGVEVAGENETGDELRSHASDPPASPARLSPGFPAAGLAAISRVGTW